MADAPTFPKLDSTTPDFWEVRWRERFTPWDAGRAPQDLVQFAATRPAGEKVLIPGCGGAWEALVLAEAGADVLAVDFSPAAVRVARERLGSWAGRARLADFFTLAEGPFDWIYERTFLCALKPSLRPDYACRMHALLRPGGLLAGYFYYGAPGGGPPFAIEPAQLEALLEEGFERLEQRAVADSLPTFAGLEKWEIWRRR